MDLYQYLQILSQYNVVHIELNIILFSSTFQFSQMLTIILDKLDNICWFDIIDNTFQPSIYAFVVSDIVGCSHGFDKDHSAF